jgi:hypothetical protein
MDTNLAHNAIQARSILGGKMFINSPEIFGLMTSANIGFSPLVTVSQERNSAAIHGVHRNNSGMLILLSDLGHKDYFLKQPLVLMVSEKDSEYVVTLADAELSRSGPTVAEAVNWLESSMVSLYELYKGESALGPLPQRQFRALGQYLGEKKAQPHRSR